MDPLLDEEGERAREAEALLTGHSVHCAGFDGLYLCTCKLISRAMSQLRGQAATKESLVYFVDSCVPEPHKTAARGYGRVGLVEVEVALFTHPGKARLHHMVGGLEEALLNMLPVGLSLDLRVVVRDPNVRVPFLNRWRRA